MGQACAKEGKWSRPHPNTETSCQQRTELCTPPIVNCLLRICHHIVIELYIYYECRSKPPVDIQILKERNITSCRPIENCRHLDDKGKLSLCLINQTPHHENVGGSGGIVPHIRHLGTRCRWVISDMSRIIGSRVSVRSGRDNQEVLRRTNRILSYHYISSIW
jgi:hypothetical protein